MLLTISNLVNLQPGRCFLIGPRGCKKASQTLKTKRQAMQICNGGRVQWLWVWPPLCFSFFALYSLLFIHLLPFIAFIGLCTHSACFACFGQMLAGSYGCGHTLLIRTLLCCSSAASYLVLGPTYGMKLR